MCGLVVCLCVSTVKEASLGHLLAAFNNLVTNEDISKDGDLDQTAGSFFPELMSLHPAALRWMTLLYCIRMGHSLHPTIQCPDCCLSPACLRLHNHSDFTLWFQILMLLH